MTYILGIDVGTSDTAAALWRPGGRSRRSTEAVPLGHRKATVASVLFLAEDGSILVGEAAEQRGLAAPDRVIREFTRRVGDDTPIFVGGRAYAAHDMVAAMIRWVVDRVVEREGTPPGRVAITHPVTWGAYKKDLVRAALAARGVAEPVFLLQAEAAAVNYAAQEPVEPGTCLAVYDLGGGTFDATVLRASADGSFQLVGTADGLDHLGGADFDEAVFGHVRSSLATEFAAADLNERDPEVLSALARLRRECTAAKEALSADTEVSVPVALPGVSGQVRLVRGEFEEMIRPALEDTLESLFRALRSARVNADDLAAVLLVGGSCRVPLVAQIVSGTLRCPVMVDADPTTTIALGAAITLAAGQAAPSPSYPAPVAPAPLAPVEPVRPAPSPGKAPDGDATDGDATDRAGATAPAGAAEPAEPPDPAAPAVPAAPPDSAAPADPAAAPGKADPVQADPVQATPALQAAPAPPAAPVPAAPAPQAAPVQAAPEQAPGQTPGQQARPPVRRLSGLLADFDTAWSRWRVPIGLLFALLTAALLAGLLIAVSLGARHHTAFPSLADMLPDVVTGAPSARGPADDVTEPPEPADPAPGAPPAAPPPPAPPDPTGSAGAGGGAQGRVPGTAQWDSPSVQRAGSSRPRAQSPLRGRGSTPSTSAPAAGGPDGGGAAATPPKPPPPGSAPPAPAPPEAEHGPSRAPGPPPPAAPPPGPGVPPEPEQPPAPGARPGPPPAPPPALNPTPAPPTQPEPPAPGGVRPRDLAMPGGPTPWHPADRCP